MHLLYEFNRSRLAELERRADARRFQRGPGRAAAASRRSRPEPLRRRFAWRWASRLA